MKPFTLVVSPKDDAMHSLVQATDAAIQEALADAIIDLVEPMLEVHEQAP